MKKILVTGGAGYIGSHMVMLLLENGYEPIVVDNYSNSNEYNLNNVKEITNKDFKIYNLNILENLEEIDTKDVYGVVHFAALKSVNESVEKPVDYYKNNVAGTINVINFAIKRGINKFIFSSTAAVYSGRAEVPLNEDSLKEPANPYGWTKLFSEQILKDAANAKQINSIALRYFNVAGNQKDGLIGENATDPKNIIPSIIVSYLGYRKQELKIFGDDYPTRDGTTIRDFIHVLDLCNAHLKALEYLDKNHGHYVFNIGTKNGSTLKEVLTTFEKVTGEKLSYTIENRRPGDVMSSVADASKANSVLGWQPQLSLEEMISSSLKWYKTGFKTANNL